MRIKPSDIFSSSIGKSYVDYTAPNGLSFTYHRELNRLVLNDGEHRTFVTVYSKVEAKKKVVIYCNTHSFDEE